ncbi:hypothetical protein [Terrimonas alba]|uniref:hypothetical protein n=1 Tax=Terrimonas alba TaxID=3349636 RepID=UPI0035F3E259
MEKNLHHIEELFKSALDDHEGVPSPNLWSTMENRLDKDNIADIKRKYTSLKRVALLILLLLISIGIYELNRHSGNDIAKRKQSNYENENLPGNTKKTLSSSKDHSSKQPTTPSIIPGNSQSSTLSDPILSIDKPISNKENISQKPVTVKSNWPGDNSTTAINPVDPNKLTKLHGSQADSKVTLSGYFIQQLPLIHSSVQHSFTLPIDPVKQLPQPIKINRPKPSRFSVTAFLSPDLASYRLENDDHGNQPDDVQKIETTENHESSSTAGILIAYRLNNRWSIQSGVSFSNINILLKPKTIYAQPDNSGVIKYRVNISSGYGYILPSFQNTPVIGDSLTATAAAHKLRYTAIPVAISYQLSKGKFSFDVMSGVSVNFLTAGVLETEVKDGANNEIDILTDIQGLKPTYFTWLAGVGTEYKLTNKLSLTLAPTARFALTSINKGSVVRSYPNSIGLVGGLKIRF